MTTAARAASSIASDHSGVRRDHDGCDIDAAQPTRRDRPRRFHRSANVTIQSKVPGRE